MENENKVIPTTEEVEILEKEPAQEQEAIELDASVATESEETKSVKTESEGVASAEKRCPNCQALLTEEQLFCPECGASFKKLCPNCKTELQEGQAFCSSCGYKIAEKNPEVNENIAQFNEVIKKQKNKKKVLPIILGVLVVCAVAACLLFTIFLNPQHYIDKGDYQTAYNVASEGAKEDILRENIAAVVSADCVDSLKDPSSFELRDAWIRFNDSSKVIILKVAGNNSYGNQIINYWYYSYDKDEKEYSLFTSFSDFAKEQYYSWDDTDERLEKLIKNMAKDTAQDIISDGVQIKDDSIDTINMLFEKDVLEDVALIDAEPKKTE